MRYVQFSTFEREQTALPRPRWSFFRVRACARCTISDGYASVSLLARGFPSRSRLKAPSTRTRKKSCAIIAALGEICGLESFGDSEHIRHVEQARVAFGDESGGAQGAHGEVHAAVGAMGDLQPFAGAGEGDGVLADDVAAA